MALLITGAAGFIASFMGRELVRRGEPAVGQVIGIGSLGDHSPSGDRPAGAAPALRHRQSSRVA